MHKGKKTMSVSNIDDAFHNAPGCALDGDAGHIQCAVCFFEVRIECHDAARVADADGGRVLWQGA